MATTSIPAGHPLAKKVFGAALFAEMLRSPHSASLRWMTGPAPTISDAANKLEKMQTNANFPIIRVTDLQSGRGDTVSVDLFNIIQGLPTMGDRKIAGRLMGLSSNSMDIKIDQMRAGIDTGGRMSQQRTVHDLRTIGRANLAGYWARATSQQKIIHAAGTRGSIDMPSWPIPLASHAEFAEIMVNPVLAPTYNRHFYAGDATGLGDIDSADLLVLDDIDKLRVRLEEFELPLQPITLPDDPQGSDDNPLYCLLVSPRVWHHLEIQTGATAWRTFLQNAQVRGSKNPLFMGGAGMWNGIVVKKMPYWIEMDTGTTETVATSADTYTETTVSVNYVSHRSILLGAQALAEVYGGNQDSMTHFSWFEQREDHDNAYQASVSAMGGMSKLRFTDSSGVDTDHGVVVIDSAAPVIT